MRVALLGHRARPAVLVAVLLTACGSSAEAPTPPPPAPVELTVFAAASLTDVLPKVAEAWTAETGHTASFSFASSSRLAKAVESGQRADVFFSADLDWMDDLAQKDLLVAGSRRNLLGNTLVAVVRADGAFAPAAPADLGSAELKHLAMAGENVPAGRYGRAALRSLGAWAAVEPRVVSGDNVRTALGWVATGEAEAGIVYATDAKAEPRVRVAFPFPADSHPPIVYPAAVLSASAHPAEANAFLDFCGSEPARRLFEAAGFSRPAAP